MAINQFNYLDFSNLLINELVGDFWLFLIIVMVIIMYFGIVNNLDFKTILSLMFVFGFGITGYYTSNVIVVVVALLVGFILYFGLSKIMK